MNKLTALIDGDVPVYSCGFAVEHRIYSVQKLDPQSSKDFDNKKEAKAYFDEIGADEIVVTTDIEPVENAIQNINTLINSIMEETGATEYRLFLTGEGNFREELVDNYKANRDPLHKPYWYKEIKDYMIKRLGAEIIDGQEADDAMSIIQYEDFCPFDPPSTVICTIDKDLDMVPGLHYKWNKEKPEEKMFFVNPMEGLHFFYKQILTGDTTDNIDGLYKLTKKKAMKKILEPIDSMDYEGDMWEYVVKIFNDEGVPTETVITNARLLWMRSTPNEMWLPPLARSIEYYLTKEELEDIAEGVAV